MDIANHFDIKRSILQQIPSEQLHKRGITLLVKRDDLIHHEVSGNKWRKLAYILHDFMQSGKQAILTFGGAYSNHLLATASACHTLKIDCYGIVRGDELSELSNPILKRCHELGMQLKFVARKTYALRHDALYHQQLSEQFPNIYIVPEGGACLQGMIGCKDVMKELSMVHHVFVAQGTSTTSCGMLWGSDKQIIHAVPVIKNFQWKQEMMPLLKTLPLSEVERTNLFQRLVVHPNYHFGGYAKETEDLRNFVDKCKTKYQLILDKIYTAKVFYATLQEIQHAKYDNTCVVFLHTGGTFLYNNQ